MTIIVIFACSLCLALFCLAKKFWHKLQVWDWKRQLRLPKHLHTLQSISTDIDGFKLSKLARANQDAMEYVYGEIDCISFVALLSLAKPNTATVFYDLGSGIGQTVLACAMIFNVKKSCGIELFPHLHHAAIQQLEQLNTWPVYQEISKKIHFICGDFLKTDFADATLIFISATAIFGENWNLLNRRIDSLSSSPTIISTSKPLMSKSYAIIHQTKVQMSWGIVSAYIQTKIALTL